MSVQNWTSIMNSCIAMLSQAPSPYNNIPPDFVQLFPQATSYAEERIYNELVPLNQRTLNTSLTTTPAQRTLPLGGASQSIVTVEQFALIYPSGQTDPTQGTLYYFDAGSLDVINILWPQQSVTVDPSQGDFIGRYWALQDNATLVFSPPGPAAYTVALTGTFAPIPISLSVPITYLSTFYPALLEAGCMIFLTGGLLRNFGAQADDPKMAMAWESTFKTLMQSAQLEEQRRRMQGAGWSQYAPTPATAPNARN
jgi:hypothetical protein